MWLQADEKTVDHAGGERVAAADAVEYLDVLRELSFERLPASPRLRVLAQTTVDISGERPTCLAYSYRVHDGADKDFWLVRWKSHPPRTGSS